MRNVAIFLVLLLLCVGTARAQEMGPKETMGTVGGALLGGVFGSMIGGNAAGHIVGGIAGAAIGGFIGNRFGASLDEQDRIALAQATKRAMTSGGRSSFSNRNTGVRGTARVTGTSKNLVGQTCRTVEQEVVLKDGSVSRDTVTGCKGPNGWSV